MDLVFEHQWQLTSPKKKKETTRYSVTSERKKSSPITCLGKNIRLELIKPLDVTTNFRKYREQ